MASWWKREEVLKCPCRLIKLRDILRTVRRKIDYSRGRVVIRPKARGGICRLVYMPKIALHLLECCRFLISFCKNNRNRKLVVLRKENDFYFHFHDY